MVRWMRIEAMMVRHYLNCIVVVAIRTKLRIDVGVFVHARQRHKAGGACLIFHVTALHVYKPLYTNAQVVTYQDIHLLTSS